jgi:hypothetical protein
MNTIQILRRYKEKHGRGCTIPDSMTQRIEQADELRDLIDKAYDRMKSELGEEGVDILDSFDFYMDIEVPAPPAECIPDEIQEVLGGDDGVIARRDCAEYGRWFTEEWTPVYLMWWEDKFKEETQKKGVNE